MGRTLRGDQRTKKNTKLSKEQRMKRRQKREELYGQLDRDTDQERFDGVGDGDLEEYQY